MIPINRRSSAKLAYVALMLGLSAIGTLNGALGFVKDAPLDGVEQGAPRPRLSLASVRTELFQHEATRWYEQHWGMRGYAVRTDNTLNRAVFSESRGIKVIVGKDGVLIDGEDVGYVNRTDDDVATKAAATRLASVQAKLLSHHTLLLPVVIPSKTSFYRSAVPARWRREGAFGRSDRTVYHAYVDTLTSLGARFVDARALLTREAHRPEEVFSPSGRHWRTSAACRVLQEVFDVARRDLPELGDANIDCHTHPDPVQAVTEEDYDLFRLLNVWGAKPSGDYVDVLDHRGAAPALRVPSLFVGSSFVWKLIWISRDLDVLRPGHFYYYNQLGFRLDQDTVEEGKITPGSSKWRTDTFSARLIVLDMPEMYLPVHGMDLLDQLDRELIAPR